MFRRNTTIVLGAGASHAYGYPLGDELISRIINLAEGNRREIDKFGRDQIGNIGKIDPLVLKMDEMLHFHDPLSIDAFLTHYAHRTDFVKAVKVAIAQNILNSGEKNNFIRGFKFEKEKAHWYRFLWNAIVDSVSPDILGDETTPLNFHVVTFNYDPSLEYFLFTRVMSETTFLTVDQQRNFLDKLAASITHVYGCLFNYVWTGGMDNDHTLKLETINQLVHPDVPKYSKNILLINERTNNLTAKKIQDLLAQCEQAIFLGFGFDDTNIGSSVLDLENTLGPREPLKKGTTLQEVLPVIKYTNYNDSMLIDAKMDVITQKLRSRLDRVRIAPEKRIIKSVKKVYQALEYDFRLNDF